MTRTVTTAAQTIVNAGTCDFAIFVEMDFSSGFVRLCNATVTLPWNTHDWVGVGGLGSIETISEASDMEAKGVSLAISGIPVAYVTTALAEYYQGRDLKIWFAPIDPATQLPATDPILVFFGRMDNMRIEMGDTATISVSGESRLADWDRARVRRFNHADQYAEYAGDMGLEYVEQMVEKELTWG